MSRYIGWALALAALVVGWRGYGWPGVALAVSVIVFWLLLEFSRSMRVLRDAGQAPVGHIDSAVMLNAKLRRGLRMAQVVKLTRSLGQHVSDDPEVWQWGDEGGARVVITFVDGRCAQWSLQRPDVPAAA